MYRELRLGELVLRELVVQEGGPRLLEAHAVVLVPDGRRRAVPPGLELDREVGVPGLETADDAVVEAYPHALLGSC